MLENSVRPPPSKKKVNKKYTFFKTCVKMSSCAFCKGLKNPIFACKKFRIQKKT